MSTDTMAPQAGPAASPPRHVAAWFVMILCGGAELLYNVIHAIRHDSVPEHAAATVTAAAVTAGLDWVNVFTAVVYGIAPVVTALALSHMANRQRDGWELAVVLGVMAGVMGLSASAVAAEVRPYAGPWWCWVFPLCLDTATLMAFRFIVVPVSARAKKAAAGPGSAPGATAGASPGAGQGSGGGGRAKAPSRPPARPAGTGVQPPAAKPAPAVAAAAGTAGQGAQVVSINPADRQPGPIEKIMRAYWDDQIAAGIVPSGGQVNLAAGKHRKYSLGKSYAARWKQEPAAAALLAAQADVAAGETTDGQQSAAVRSPDGADNGWRLATAGAGER